MRYLPIEKIHDDAVLAMPVYSGNGSILLNANTVLKRSYLTKLMGLGFAGLYIYDEISEDITVEALVSEELRIETLKALSSLNIDTCRLMAHSIVDELLKKPHASIDMVNVASFDNYTYTHSLDVAVLSVMIGLASGLNYDQLKRLSEGALLHDIGKMNISLDILNKNGPLTEEEMAVVRLHPADGYQMIKGDSTIPATVKEAVHAHHENEDGSGYPRGLIGNKIPSFARIIHVCDVYDALTSNRIYRRAINPADAMEYLMSNCYTMFAVKYVKKLMEYVTPYPTGITVELSDGRHAIVVRQNNTHYLRPCVRLLDTREEIDLMKVLNLTIIQIVI
ncbi:MAG: HD-GYP domain-containing protein [Clostridia bacterium]|nr:HD-GYP domain-containing protein [Clostridia bacterium]